MADIFLSWGLPDADRVLPIAARLRSLGLSVFEYSEEMRGGDDIKKRVVREVDAAQLALICFSDETANRPWIEREVAFAYASKEIRDPEKKLVPVWVGPHPDDRKPSLIDELGLAIEDLHASGDDGLLRLAEQVIAALGRDAPIVVPAVLLAMVSEQAEALIADGLDGPLASLRNLCCALGMPGDADLAAALRSRYGERPHDFAPFVPGESMRETLQKTVDRINARRRRERRRPLYLRWVGDTLFGGAGTAADEARTAFKSSPSLLVVDSISACCGEVRAHLDRLPHADNKGQAAVLWVPPFTSHTGGVEELLRRAARENPLLGDVFDEWVTSMRPASFTSLTPTTMDLAAERLLAHVPDEPDPDQACVEAVREVGRPARSLNAFVGATGGGGRR